MSSANDSLGAVSTSHHLATEAAAAVLEAGGNAIDAAITAAAALCVVYPNNVALGGDLVALVRSPDGQVRFLNATGTAPSSQTLEALREQHGERLPKRGVDTISVPGGVRGWEALHNLAGTRNWSAHFEAAIRYADDGVPMARSVANAIVKEREDLAEDAGCRAVFLPKGAPIAAGTPFLQPQLADSLRKIASNGADEFYTGDVAKRWVQGLSQLGSKITLEDTANYAAEWDTPIEREFSGYRVITSPPNTSGFALLRSLQEVDSASNVALLDDGAGDLARAFYNSNTVRAAALADPRFGGASGEELMAMAVPHERVSGSPRANGDTVGLSAISADGWAISLVNSVYQGFGACVLEPSTGVLFQNRGTSFSLDPASPNSFAPNKRPKHTLMPVLVLRGNKVAWVPATMGGSAQPQIHAQLLLRSFAGATPQEATHAPRWIVDEVPEDGPVTVTIEDDIPQNAREAISSAGFVLKPVPMHTESLGHSNLIKVTPSGYEAASDPRSDGSAIVVHAQNDRVVSHPTG